MFMTKRLEVTDSNFGGNRFEFNVVSTGSNQYLTERFELYSQNNKYIFNHNVGCSIAKEQINHKIFLRHNIIYIIQRIIPATNEWKHINDKRLALWNILTYKEE